MATPKKPSKDVRVLAEAVRDAIDVPYPASYTDGAKRYEAMRERVARVLGTLEYLCDDDRADLQVALRTLRKIADTPPDYPVREDEMGGAE